MRTIRAIFFAAQGLLPGIALVLLAGTPLWAHHSFQAEYDETHQITLTGTVSKVQWRNPHVLVDLSVRDESGIPVMWSLELASPHALMSQGWKVDSLKRGDQITVTGFPSRDGSRMASIRKVTLVSK